MHAAFVGEGKLVRVVFGLIGGGTLLISVSLFAQGGLAPPGAPAPTMKTLQQIEPRTPISSLPFNILTSGSYYVMTNLTGVSGSDGITVFVSGVTIDLGGFSLTGATNGSSENAI